MNKVRVKTMIRSDDTEEALMSLVELLPPWEVVKAYCLTPDLALGMLKRASWGQPPCASCGDGSEKRQPARSGIVVVFGPREILPSKESCIFSWS